MIIGLLFSYDAKYFTPSVTFYCSNKLLKNIEAIFLLRNNTYKSEKRHYFLNLSLQVYECLIVAMLLVRSGLELGAK